MFGNNVKIADLKWEINTIKHRMDYIAELEYKRYEYTQKIINLLASYLDIRVVPIPAKPETLELQKLTRKERI